MHRGSRPIEPAALPVALPVALARLLFVLGALALPSVASAEEPRVLRAEQVKEDDGTGMFCETARLKRMESIRLLREMIQEAPLESGGPRAEMMFRLAELYFEQGREDYLAEMAAFDVESGECYRQPGCDPDTVQPNNAESTRWQEQAVSLYERVVEHHSDYRRADEVLFSLAQALTELKRAQEALPYFERLVSQFPDSPHLPDAYVSLGEYYFDAGNPYKALVNYKKATAYTDSAKYGFASYKLGWCYYNLGDYDAAIASMKRVLLATAVDTAQSRLTLREEALKDLVFFLAEAGEVEGAYAVIDELGERQLVRGLLADLAERYRSQGRREEAIQTWRRLIARSSLASDGPQFQEAIVNAYQEMGDSRRSLAEIERMGQDYGAESRWAKVNAMDPDVLASADERFERSLRESALYNHRRARALKGDGEAAKSRALADRAYSLYLASYQASPNTYTMRVSYAELLWEMSRYDEAYDQYMWSVATYPTGPHSEHAAESAVFAAEAVVRAEGAQVSQGERMPLSEPEERLLAAIDQYLALFPSGPKVVGVLYESAYVLYRRGHLAEAAERFRRVIALDPGSTEAEQAANLILDSLVLREDWAALETNARFYYEQEGLGSAEFKREVLGIYQRAALKRIEVSFASSGDRLAAADAYVRFVRTFPSSEENARALNNAAVYYAAEGELASSMSVRQTLVDDPRFGPKSKYYLEQLLALGFDYERIADFRKAAETYERGADTYLHGVSVGAPATSERRAAVADALYSAGVFRDALGDTHAAIDDYTAFVTAFSDDERHVDLRFALGGLYEAQGESLAAEGVYRGLLALPGDELSPGAQAQARLRLGTLLRERGETAQAGAVWGEAVGVFRARGEPSEDSAEAVAEMMFALAEPELEDYFTLALGEELQCGAQSRRVEERAMVEAMRAKAQALVALEERYGEVIRTGSSEWGVASLVMLGRAYEEMGERLLDSHIPCALSEEQREIYRLALEDRRYLQVEKAVAAYVSAVDKARELAIDREEVTVALERLEWLRPDEFPGLREVLPEVHEVSSEGRSFDFSPAYTQVE